MAGRERFSPTPADRTKLVQLPPSADDLPERTVIDLNSKTPAIPIAIVDDTPEDDRGRPTELDYSLADQEEDLRDISGRTKKRIERLKFETHTERRAREAAERERDAAVQLATQQRDELERLRRGAETGATALANSMKAEREARLADAKRRLAAAHADGDAEAIATATRARRRRAPNSSVNSPPPSRSGRLPTSRRMSSAGSRIMTAGLTRIRPRPRSRCRSTTPSSPATSGLSHQNIRGNWTG